MIAALLFIQVSDIRAAEYFPLYEGHTAKTLALVQPYFDCAFEAAGKFEQSGDAPTEIVKAAMAYCENTRENLVATMDADIAMSQKPVPAGTEANVMGKFDTWMEDHLRMRVVAKRAMKAQK